MQRWAFWARRPKRDRSGASDTLYFSFDGPPLSTRHSHGWVRKVVAAWRDVDTICGIRSVHVLKPLLRRTLLHHLRTRGLRPTPDDPQMLYFPRGLLRNNLLWYRRPDGRRVYRMVVGERSWRASERFAYHQAVTFDICTDLPGHYAARFRIRLHITDCDGNPLPAVAANARRRRLTRDWYNREWLARHLALMRVHGRRQRRHRDVRKPFTPAVFIPDTTPGTVRDRRSSNPEGHTVHEIIFRSARGR